MRQCLFLYYEWFIQNLEKGCIRTNMHTTVRHKRDETMQPLIQNVFYQIIDSCFYSPERAYDFYC
jgi:hypothetical protein